MLSMRPCKTRAKPASGPFRTLTKPLMGLFIRIRRNWSEFAGVPQSGLVERGQVATPGPFPRLGPIVLQAAGAITVLFFMLPVLTGGFLLYMFVNRVTGPVIANLLLAVAALSLAGYLYSRLRAPSPPDGEESE